MPPITRLRLSFACGAYDRILDLASGAIRPDGIDLVYMACPPHEIFWRMLRHSEWDAAEMSTAAYITLRARGDDRFIAIPAFVSRSFRHGCVFVRAGAGIREPQDLRGRAVGVSEYHMTTAIWIRGFLQHDYGVAPADIRWCTGGQEQPGREERIELHLPPEIRVEPIPDGRWLNEMLLAGDIDAIIGPRRPVPFPDPQGRIVRLFPEFRAVEQDYYRRTGLFPIHHSVVIRREVYDRDPWVAESLYKALLAAKEAAVLRMRNIAVLATSLAWQIAELEATEAVLGPDPWPYGVEANRRPLNALRQYLQEQGLVTDPPPLEDLFAPSTLKEYRT